MDLRLHGDHGSPGRRVGGVRGLVPQGRAMNPRIYLDAMRDVEADDRLTDDERADAVASLLADYHAEMSALRRDECHE